MDETERSIIELVAKLKLPCYALHYRNFGHQDISLSIKGPSKNPFRHEKRNLAVTGRGGLLLIR